MKSITCGRIDVMDLSCLIMWILLHLTRSPHTQTRINIIKLRNILTINLLWINMSLHTNKLLDISIYNRVPKSGSWTCNVQTLYTFFFGFKINQRGCFFWTPQGTRAFARSGRQLNSMNINGIWGRELGPKKSKLQREKGREKRTQKIIFHRQSSRLNSCLLLFIH